MSERAAPVPGPVLTGGTRWLLAFALVGFALIIWRFAVGLGASTALNDGYPWGIWIAFDVVTGTALACGGYAMALMVYVFNKGRYHALVRPAILTSALGYSIAAIAIVIDVGRPWFIYRIPVSVGKWNLNSALLEVALCVMAYVIVLWLELSPAFLEKWSKSSKEGLANFARRTHSIVDKALIWIIALGLLLPTMHQSSLGSVIMLAGPRLHPLWHTPFLPLLFLVSCVAMGYAMVVAESTLSARLFGRKREDAMLVRLARPIAWVMAAFLVLRFADLLVRGRGAMMFEMGLYSTMFWIEAILAVAAILLLMRSPQKLGISTMWKASLAIVLFGSLYRFDAYLVAYRPSEGFSYFPAVPETLVTLGLVSFEILLYVILVKNFPILSGVKPATAER